MGGVHLQVVRECDRCPAIEAVSIELGQRDGQLTARLDQAIPPDWKSIDFRGYGYGRHTEVMCPECASKVDERDVR